MEGVSALEQALTEARGVVAGVRPEQMGDPTPCAEFDVRTLLNHMVGGTVMFGAAAERGAVSAVDMGTADRVGDDPLGAYDRATKETLEAWRQPGVMGKMLTLPFATLPAPIALNINLMEALVHGWDLAKATGQPTALDQDLAEATLEFARQMITDELRDGTIFAAEVTIADDAPAADRLAAFTGRRP